MRDFEKDLSNVTRQEFKVEEFRRTLRRDLLNAMQAGHTPRWKLAFGFASTAATALAVLLVVFIVDPAVPVGLHALLVSGEPAVTDSGVISPEGAGPEREIELTSLLSQLNAGPQVDQAFLESWYRQQSRPVDVKAVGGEKLLALRQFELASGERVVVLTEIGDRTKRKVSSVQEVKRTF